MYKEIFIQAMKSILQYVDYVQDGCEFYFYRRSIQVVECISFDMLAGGSDFYICGGAAAFCNNISIYPNNQLSIQCYDVNEYSSKQGVPSLVNLCISSNTGGCKRYGKRQFIEQLDRNLELFQKTLLRDIMKIDSLDDYYNFKVKADAYGHKARIPFPTIDTFYLCIQLGKIHEAAVIAFSMIIRDDPSFHQIDKILSMKMTKAAQSTENVEDVCILISCILNTNLEKLKIELKHRIDESQRICDIFFEKRSSC